MEVLAGSVLLVSLLVKMLPVTGRGAIWCVTYPQNETCGFKGSSVEIPCSYPSNTEVTKIVWSTHWGRIINQQDLSQDAAYSGRTKYLRRTSSDCTLRLTDLKESDASYYYVTYHFNYFSVDVLVQQLDGGQRLAVAGQKVTEGQRIILTCVPTCAATLNSRLTYIWYKNGLKLSGGSAKENFLRLDPIRNEDTGSYSCAMIGHEDLPSPAVNLSVEYGPRDTTLSVEISSDGTEKGSNRSCEISIYLSIYIYMCVCVCVYKMYIKNTDIKWLL
uniref:Ig-like domain-containing protein n=1 Tax=Myripristis murdjan TaxID=586833 RepID=A0A668A0Y2_9TELE